MAAPAVDDPVAGTRCLDQSRIPGVAQKVLSQRLRQLERDGLVIRTAYAERPQRVEYEATEVAVSLVPIFSQLESWSSKNYHSIEKAREDYTGNLVT
ncbi:winged helix-turn-helix transcriptional regulator [Kribbella sp. NPDC020789]